MIKIIRNINLKGMVLNMDYDLKTNLGGFGSFETQEQAERVIMLFDKTKVGNLV